LRRSLSRNNAAGARLVVDNENLTEPLADIFTDGARRDVAGAAGRLGDQKLDRTAWLGVRGGEARRQHCSGRCEN
jgi:hypothetical protein